MSLSHFDAARLLALAFGIVGIASAAGNALDNESALLQKHTQFLQARLDSTDDLVHASALQALAAWDRSVQMGHLTDAVRSSSAVLRGTGLLGISGHADPHLLEVVKDLLAGTELKEMGDGGISADALTNVSGSLEVLFTSGDTKMRAFAIEWLQKELRRNESSFIWSTLYDPIGQYDIRELAPLVRETATDHVKRFYAAFALAKLGDETAQKRLRNAIDLESPEMDIWLTLASDPMAMQAARIDKKQFVAVVKRHQFEDESDKAILLSYLGDTNELLQLVRKLVAGGDFPGGTHGAKPSMVLIVAAKTGDKGFLDSLDEIFERSEDEEQMRVDCSAAIVQIMTRERGTVSRPD